jgi:hypothetical protein
MYESSTSNAGCLGCQGIGLGAAPPTQLPFMKRAGLAPEMLRARLEAAQQRWAEQEAVEQAVAPAVTDELPPPDYDEEIIVTEPGVPLWVAPTIGFFAVGGLAIGAVLLFKHRKAQKETI